MDNTIGGIWEIIKSKVKCPSFQKLLAMEGVIYQQMERANTAIAWSYIQL